MAKIIDNPSTKELLEQLRAFESLEVLWKAVPFAKRLFPRGTKTFEQFQEIREQAAILLVPDQFNDTFSKAGWIAYESMSLDIMIAAIMAAEQNGLPAAEQVLADYYH